jgi:D-inositol-3-phosphate glycosyltransferase
VALEAQACGTPVWPPPSAACTTAVADGMSGLLVPTHRVDEFADALGRIATDPHLREKMGGPRSRHAHGFGWS